MRRLDGGAGCGACGKGMNAPPNPRAAPASARGHYDRREELADGWALLRSPESADRRRKENVRK